MQKTSSSIQKFTVAFLFILGVCWRATLAQAATVDFEDVPLSPGGYYNGSDLAGGFTSRGVFFPNSFTDWGFGDCILGQLGLLRHHGRDHGHGRQSIQRNYWRRGKRLGPIRRGLSEFYHRGLDHFAPVSHRHRQRLLTNTTYAYYTMLNGNRFAKKFGGASGADPDWFKLTITGKNASGDIDRLVRFLPCRFSRRGFGEPLHPEQLDSGGVCGAGQQRQNRGVLADFFRHGNVWHKYPHVLRHGQSEHVGREFLERLAKQRVEQRRQLEFCRRARFRAKRRIQQEHQCRHKPEWQSEHPKHRLRHVRGGAFTFNNNTLTLDAGGSITVAGSVAASQTFNCKLALAGGGFLVNDSLAPGQKLIINGDIQNAAASGVSNLVLGGVGNGLIGGAISDGTSGGALAVVKQAQARGR